MGMSKRKSNRCIEVLLPIVQRNFLRDKHNIRAMNYQNTPKNSDKNYSRMFCSWTYIPTPWGRRNGQYHCQYQHYGGGYIPGSITSSYPPSTLSSTSSQFSSTIRGRSYSYSSWTIGTCPTIPPWHEDPLNPKSSHVTEGWRLLSTSQ